MRNYDALFVGGQWRPSKATDRIDIQSPSTEQIIGSVPVATRDDLDAAVAAARGALTDSPWSRWTATERADAMDRLVEVLTERTEERARLTSSENGMPITLSRFAEGEQTAGILAYYAHLARTMQVEEERPRVDGTGRTVVRREPVGVVAAVVPWNYPQVLAMFKLAPALAAGCTVVVKPAPETSLSAFEIAECARMAGIPDGVINVVSGGADVGAALVDHPGVDKVAFTGSTAAGRAIGEVCGRRLRPVTLELGGKSAAIVLDDADLQTTVEGLAMASLLNTGQTCYLSTRILVPRARQREVVEALGGMADALAVGDPFDEATQIGPLVSSTHRDRVESYIQRGKASGATLVAGGGRPTHTSGWYVEPTIFADVDNSATIAREEIFGPVLSVIAYSNLDEAVAIANDSDYGLGGSIWTSDEEKGLELARRIDTGAVGVNRFDLDVGAPFGGVKDSGLGHELGPEGLASYQRVKSIFLS